MDNVNQNGQCPHLEITQCPSPKKGLAHAIVQCNIHLGRIVDPRILPCGHSFCSKCLKILYEEQLIDAKKSKSGKSSLLCPLCRRENQVESMDSLTINYAIVDLLEIFDAEEKEDARIKRETLSEMDHTIGILKSLRSKCDDKLRMNTCDAFYTDCLKEASLATEKRLSYLQNLAQGIEIEKDHSLRERMIRNLQYTSLAYQRLAEMFEGETQLDNGQKEAMNIEETKRVLDMYKNAVVLEYKPTETMTERKSRVWFSFMFSLLIDQCWKEMDHGRYSNAATVLANQFSKKFDDGEGVWIAVVGQRPLGCWIWKDEHDYACLDVDRYRLIVYRRKLHEKSHATNGHSNGRIKLTQGHLDKILKEAVQLKQNGGWHELNVAKFIRERLQMDAQGYFWHTAAGNDGRFAVAASVHGGDAVDLHVKSSKVENWNALVWEGRDSMAEGLDATPIVVPLIEGYCNETGAANAFMACGSVTLVKQGQLNVLVDCGSPWDSQRLIDELKKNYLRPQNIQYLICTHGHIDHIGNMNLFTEAQILLDTDFGTKPGFYGSHNYSGNRAFPISDHIDVILTPGHTHRDLSVIVRNVEHKGTVVIAGDIFESESDLDNDQLWQQTSYDVKSQLQSRKQILEIADWIVPGHGPIFQVPIDEKNSSSSQCASP